MRNEVSRCWRAAAFVTLASLSSASGVAGQEWRDFRSARQVNDVGSLEMHVVYAAGRLTLGPSEGRLLYDANLHYDANHFEPQRSWRLDGDRGRLRLAVSSVPSADESDEDGTVKIEWDDWELDFDLENLPRSGSETGQLDVRLNRSVPIALKVRAGAARTRLELGGLTLTSVEIATGASDARVAFGSANQTRMDQLSMKSAAAEFSAEGLGNARFDHFDFGALIGDVTLDFAGDWDGDATAKIKMGLGELMIRVPTEIGVRIQRKSLLTSFSAEDFERDGDVYVSPNWDSAAIQLDIELEAGLVSVEVERH